MGKNRRGFCAKQNGGQILVQPLKLPILQVRVLPQELPIRLGSYIRLTRR